MAAPLLHSPHANNLHIVAKLAYKLHCANVSNLICVVVVAHCNAYYMLV